MVNGIDVWDSASGGFAWQYFALSGQPRYACAATALGNSLFVAGGAEVDTFPYEPMTADVAVFDFGSGSVSQRTLSLQVPRLAIAAFSATAQGIAVFAGGVSDYSGTASFTPWRNDRALEWYGAAQQAMQIDSATTMPVGTVPKPQTYLPVDVAGGGGKPICTDAAGNAYIFARGAPVYVLPAPTQQQTTTSAASVTTTTAPVAGTTTATARNPSATQDSAAASQRAAVATALFAVALLAIA